MNRMQTIGILFSLSLVFAMPCHTAASPDSIYHAGSMLGQRLYWTPQVDLVFDTTRWQEAQQIALNRQPDSTRSLRQALQGLRASGHEVYRLGEPSIAVICLMRQMGYPVLLVTQWHGTLKEKVVVPRPGLVQTAFRHTILSEYLWEILERSEVFGKTVSEDDLRMRLFFHNAGFCEYDGKDDAFRVNRQMQGVQGFTVTVQESSYNEDLNMRRRILGAFVIAEAGKKPDAIIKELEKSMDKNKLDLSYRMPTIKPVK